MDMTTVARVKALFPVSNTNADTQIARWISFYSAHFEKRMGRYVERIERTAYFDLEPHQTRFRLPGVPVASVASVHHDSTRAWGTATLLDPSLYHVDLERGILTLDGYSPASNYRDLPQTSPGVIRVVYTGGMATDTEATGTTDGFVDLYPDLAAALDMQVAYVMQRRDQLGSTSVAGAGANKSYEGAVDLLPDVKRTVLSHRLMGM